MHFVAIGAISLVDDIQFKVSRYVLGEGQVCSRCVRQGTVNLCGVDISIELIFKGQNAKGDISMVWLTDCGGSWDGSKTGIRAPQAVDALACRPCNNVYYTNLHSISCEITLHLFSNHQLTGIFPHLQVGKLEKKLHQSC